MDGYNFPEFTRTKCCPIVGYGGALALLASVLAIPFLRELFRFFPLDSADLLLCVVAGLASILWFEAVKLVTPKSKAQLLVRA